MKELADNCRFLSGQFSQIYDFIVFLEWWLYITTSSLIFWEQMAMKSKNHLDNQFCGGFVAIFDTRAFLTMGFVGLICNGRIKLRSLKMGDLQW